MPYTIVSVLIVEDLKIAQQVAARVFQSLNCKVTIAPTAAIALEKIIQEKFDGIFVDINLPDVNGFELAKTIRSMERKIRRPIIALTANSSSELNQQCKESGIDDFITKPLTVESARHMLHKHFHHKFDNYNSKVS